MKNNTEKKVMKKKGNLETFLKDGTKIYIKKGGKLSLVPLEKVTEAKYPEMFYFLYNNWEKIMDAYFWGNKGNLQYNAKKGKYEKKKLKPVKFIIKEPDFKKVTKEIKGITDTVTLAFSSHQEFLILTCKQPEKKETKKIKIPNL